MAAIESRGTSSEIKEQYEKHKKFVGGRLFIFFPLKGITKTKEDCGKVERWKKKRE